MKKIVVLCLTLLMAVTSFVGCGPTTSTGDSNATTQAAGSDSADKSADKATDTTTPAGKKAISINIASEPPELLSVLTTDTTSMTVLRHVVENLVMLDENNEVIPGVAESWEYDAASLTYTFKLRQNSKWSTGQPVTAKDFVFAWQTLVNPKTAAEYSYMGYILKNGEAIATGKMDVSELGVKAVDDYTLQVTLERPVPYALSMFSFVVFAPINEENYTTLGETYGKDANTLPTNGAFKVASWTHESDIVLAKNTEYWNVEKVNLDEVKMLMISDTNAALNEFKSGGAQMIGLNGEQAAQMKSEGNEVLTYDDGSCWYFEFNTTKEGLKNAKIRRALTLGVDAKLFIEGVVKNSSTVATSFTPPAVNGVSGKFKDAVGDLIPRDNNFAEAKRLLEEGMKEEGLTSLNLSYICDDGDTAAKYAAYFQEQWKKNLGVEVTIQAMPFKSRIERMQNKDFDIVMAGWGPDYNDPMTFLDLFVTGGGNNHTSYSSAEYDALIKAATEEADVNKRQELLIQAEKVLMTDLPIGPIYNRARDYIVADGLTGVIRTAFQDINVIYADYVAK